MRAPPRGRLLLAASVHASARHGVRGSGDARAQVAAGDDQRHTTCTSLLLHRPLRSILGGRVHRPYLQLTRAHYVCRIFLFISHPTLVLGPRSLARSLSIARLSLSLAHPPTNQSSIEPYPGFLLSWDQSLSRSVQPIHILLPSTQPSPAQPSPHAPRHHIQQPSTPTRVEGDHPPHLNAQHCSLATTPLVTDITTRPDPTIRRPSHSPRPGPPSLSS